MLANVRFDQDDPWKPNFVVYSNIPRQCRRWARAYALLPRYQRELVAIDLIRAEPVDAVAVPQRSTRGSDRSTGWTDSDTDCEPSGLGVVDLRLAIRLKPFMDIHPVHAEPLLLMIAWNNPSRVAHAVFRHDDLPELELFVVVVTLKVLQFVVGDAVRVQYLEDNHYSLLAGWHPELVALILAYIEVVFANQLHHMDTELPVPSLASSPVPPAAGSDFPELWMLDGCLSGSEAPSDDDEPRDMSDLTLGDDDPLDKVFVGFDPFDYEERENVKGGLLRHGLRHEHEQPGLPLREHELRLQEHELQLKEQLRLQAHELHEQKLEPPVQGFELPAQSHLPPLKHELKHAPHHPHPDTLKHDAPHSDTLKHHLKPPPTTNSPPTSKPLTTPENPPLDKLVGLAPAPVLAPAPARAPAPMALLSLVLTLLPLPKQTFIADPSNMRHNDSYTLSPALAAPAAVKHHPEYLLLDDLNEVECNYDDVAPGYRALFLHPRLLSRPGTPTKLLRPVRLPQTPGADDDDDFVPSWARSRLNSKADPLALEPPTLATRQLFRLPSRSVLRPTTRHNTTDSSKPQLPTVSVPPLPQTRSQPLTRNLLFKLPRRPLRTLMSAALAEFEIHEALHDLALVPRYIKDNKRLKYIKVGKVQKYVHLFEEQAEEPGSPVKLAALLAALLALPSRKLLVAQL